MISVTPRPIRVLIVEDKFLHRTKLKKLVLQSKGEVAGVCKSLEDFRKQFKQLSFDLAIVDLNLGKEVSNRDGWMVAAEINASDRPRPIIICSQYNEQELWRTVPRMHYVTTMGKDAKLNQFLMAAYPLIHKFYPDANRMFRFHSGGSSPTEVNYEPGEKFLVKNDALGYSQMIDPAMITMVTSRPRSKIMIYYEDQQIEFSQSLGGLMKIANNPKLARVSDSVIVNYDYVHGKHNSSIFVKTWGNIKEVSIGKAYAANVEDWWRHFRSN